MHNLTIYSIGHSDHSMEQFIGLLEKFHINCLVDVRSVPYSKRIPQFNRELLKIDLQEKGIKYVYLGDKLGGRYSDPKFLLDNKQVNYDKVRGTKLFIEGLEEIIGLIKNNDHVVFMCAEKDPFSCHRYFLVSRSLSSKGVEVRHILAGGEVVLNEDLDKKLIKRCKCDHSEPDLFELSKTV